MGDTLLVQRHERSGRTAIVADEADSVWRPAADCWLFNRIDTPAQAVLRSQLDAYRARALPPAAPADLGAEGRSAPRCREGGRRARRARPKDGKVVCFFQSAQQFKSRYATFGFSDEAKLDEGAM